MYHNRKVVTMRDIHYYEQKISRTLANITNSEHIKKKDKETILRIYEDLKLKGLSHARILRYLYCLKKISEMYLSHDILNLKEQDIRKIALNIIEYSLETKKEFRKTIKLLQKYNPKIPDLEIHESKKQKLPSALSIEQIYQILYELKQVNKHAYMLTFFLWDSGARIGEAFNLKVKDLYFDTYGCKVKLSGKTGERVIRLLECYEELRKYVSNKSPENYVFKISYISYTNILKKIGKKLGLDLYPYIFRHSRATFLAKFLNEYMLCMIFGWKIGSKIPRVYIHLSGADIDNVLINLSQKVISQIYQISSKLSQAHKYSLQQSRYSSLSLLRSSP